MAIPIVGKLSRPHNHTIATLQKQKMIKWLENYSGGNNINNSRNSDVKALEQELVELLEEDAKADKLRSLPFFV